MPRFRVECLEKAVARVTYYVEADDATQASDRCAQGFEKPETEDLEDVTGGWIETVKIEPIDETPSIDMAYSKAIATMTARITAACRAAGHDDVNLCYSAYRISSDELPIDNLDEVAIQGTCRLVMPGGTSGIPYQSDVLRSPTWLEVCVCANVMIPTVGLEDHVFLEGVDRSPVKTGRDGVPCYKFHMGS
jgi:hypothetical protein